MLDEDDLLLVPLRLEPQLASIFHMATYFLLRDYHGRLVPGDWVMQNAAMGTVIHLVSQLATLYGIICDRRPGGEEWF